MDFLQSLLESSSIPVLTAFLLGLLTAISPCPLATNITAIGFISKEIENRNVIFARGLLYTLGRIVAYSALGFILIPLLREGASVYGIQKIIGKYGEQFIGPALILIGLFMLFGDKIKLPKFGYGGDGGDRLKGRGSVGAFLLGVLFSLAFCPTSGVFYFGMLIPMSAAESGGYLLPAVYALATGLPVLIVAWLLAYSMSGLGRFYNRMQLFQRWMNLIIAFLFIGVGFYYIILFYI